ncbi:hypothetical protein Sru01_43610 [Sphaerisporangium rufum]|uniref:DNA-directed RNA polymerase specialized sigma subunit, sigma24 family n=1 Tax=Sphaerisporangium rufum TaxID=1381558 RepID=A0A919V154_9ACTN|nr:hypothetical protein [Sphaerisporangium rufum]GII79379.1 hypothetical protein Sru01_43610 [Sphaerisporangium rufum]
MTPPLIDRRPRNELIAELYDRHAAGLFAYCHDQLGDTAAAADALASALAGAPAQDAPRATLYALARREIYRRDVAYAPPAADPADPVTALIERIAREMRPHQREVLLLTTVCGLDTGELATVLDVAADTAEQLLIIARDRFARSLAAAAGVTGGSGTPVVTSVQHGYRALAAMSPAEALARLPWRAPPGALRARVLAAVPAAPPSPRPTAGPGESPTADPATGPTTGPTTGPAFGPTTRSAEPAESRRPTTPRRPLPLTEPDPVTGTGTFPATEAAAPRPTGRRRSRHETSTEPMPQVGKPDGPRSALGGLFRRRPGDAGSDGNPPAGHSGPYGPPAGAGTPAFPGPGPSGFPPPGSSAFDPPGASAFPPSAFAPGIPGSSGFPPSGTPAFDRPGVPGAGAFAPGTPDPSAFHAPGRPAHDRPAHQPSAFDPAGAPGPSGFDPPGRPSPGAPMFGLPPGPAHRSGTDLGFPDPFGGRTDHERPAAPAGPWNPFAAETDSPRTSGEPAFPDAARGPAGTPVPGSADPLRTTGFPGSLRPPEPDAFTSGGAASGWDAFAAHGHDPAHPFGPGRTSDSGGRAGDPGVAAGPEPEPGGESLFIRAKSSGPWSALRRRLGHTRQAGDAAGPESAPPALDPPAPEPAAPFIPGFDRPAPPDAFTGPPTPPSAFGTPAPYDKSSRFGTPAPFETPGPFNTPAPYVTPSTSENPSAFDTPAPYGTPAPYVTSTASEAASPLGTPAPYDTPAPYGTPSTSETPSAFDTPGRYDTPGPSGSPGPYETPAAPQPAADGTADRSAGAAPVPPAGPRGTAEPDWRDLPEKTTHYVAKRRSRPRHETSDAAGAVQGVRHQAPAGPDAPPPVAGTEREAPATAGELPEKIRPLREVFSAAKAALTRRGGSPASPGAPASTETSASTAGAPDLAAGRPDRAWGADSGAVPEPEPGRTFPGGPRAGSAPGADRPAPGVDAGRPAPGVFDTDGFGRPTGGGTDLSSLSRPAWVDGTPTDPTALEPDPFPPGAPAWDDVAAAGRPGPDPAGRTARAELPDDDPGADAAGTRADLGPDTGRTGGDLGPARSEERPGQDTPGFGEFRDADPPQIDAGQDAPAEPVHHDEHDGPAQGDARGEPAGRGDTGPKAPTWNDPPGTPDASDRNDSPGGRTGRDGVDADGRAWNDASGYPGWEDAPGERTGPLAPVPALAAPKPARRPVPQDAAPAEPSRPRRSRPFRGGERHYDWLWEVGGFLLCVVIALLVFFAVPTLVTP